MTRIMILMAAVLAMTACGVEEAEDGTSSGGNGPTTGSTGTSPDAGTPAVSDAGTTDPVDSEGLAPFVGKEFKMYFSLKYIANACAELRGPENDVFPGTWSSGPTLSVQKGMYLELLQSVPPGVYLFTYVGKPCGGTVSTVNPDWPAFVEANIVKMTADERAGLYCNWYDSALNRCITASPYSCNLQYEFDTLGNATPKGNMRNFVGCGK